MKDLCVVLPDWFALSAFLLFILCFWVFVRRIRAEGVDWGNSFLLAILISAGLMAVATLAVFAMGFVFESAKSVFGAFT